MKQISLYFSLSDFKEKIDSGIVLGIPNVLQHGSGFDEKYVYGRIAFTNQSNSGLFSLVSSAGWNKFSDSAITTTELLVRNWMEVRDLFSGGPGISDMTDFKYFNGVSYIPKEMFSGWTSLQTITIPESVTNIETGAFSDFPVTAEINFAGDPSAITSGLPKNVEVVYYSGSSNYTFYNKSAENEFLNSLDLVWVSGGGITERFIQPNDFKSTFFETFGTTVSGSGSERMVRVKYLFKNDINDIPYATFSGMSQLISVVISDGFTSVGDFAFINAGLENVYIGEGVKEIGQYAFAENYYVTGLTLPSSLEVVRYRAFFQYASYSSSGAVLSWDAKNIMEIADYAFSNAKFSNQRIVFDKNLKKIGKGAFSNSTSYPSRVKEYDASNSVLEEIGEEAFAHSQNLVSIKLPNNTLKSIGQSAFSGCSLLSGFTIPESIVTMSGSNIFYKCYFLDRDFVNNSSLDPEDYNYWGATICQDSFADNNILVKDNLINYIRYKNKLVDVVIPDYVIGFSGGTDGLENAKFSNCGFLTSVTIGSGITSLPRGCFSRCYVLKTVTIPNGVTEIGTECFQYCSSISSITIPDSVTSLGSYCFSNCYGLENVTLGSGITKIQSYIFYGDNKLTSVTIPDTVLEIDTWAFYASSYFASGCCEIYGNIYYPNNTLAFKAVSKTGTSFTLKSTTKVINERCFSGCGAFTSITIPDSVERINASAFTFCTGLTNGDSPIRVTYGTGLTYIGNYAFYGVAGTNGTGGIIVPDSVTGIGAYAFNSAGRDPITIGSGVTSIGEYAFTNNAFLSSIYCKAPVVPTMPNANVFGSNPDGFYNFYYPRGADYSSIQTSGATLFQRLKVVTLIETDF